MRELDREMVQYIVDKGLKEFTMKYPGDIPTLEATEMIKLKPNLIYMEQFIDKVELSIEFALNLIKLSSVYMIFSCKFVTLVNTSDEVFEAIIKKLEMTHYNARHINCNDLTSDTIYKILDRVPMAVLRMRNTTRDYDYYAFKRMTHIERLDTFSQLHSVDDALFHGKFDQILIEKDEEFMLFVIKTMLILLEDHAYNPIYNQNAPKLNEYLKANLNNYDKLMKKAKMELKLNTDEHSCICSSIMPF